jgi:glycosyltransferase involved in cell wall biosynthesis
MCEVSFIVPSYNYAHFIERCIDSIVAQTVTDWELIICDDQSQDDSMQVLEKYTDHPQIQAYLNEQNLGLYPNIVRCISYTKGAFIKILMADDWLHPDYLEKTLEIFKKYPTVGLCSVRTDVYNDAYVHIVTRKEPEIGRDFYPRDKILNWTTRMVSPIGNPSRVIFRRAAYEEIGGFDLAIEYCTEAELWIRMLERWDCGFVTEIMSYELLHQNTATRDYIRDARHLTTGEQMYHKLFQTHTYYQGHWRRQQTVWLRGWREYWMISLRRMMEGNATEIKTLISILNRRTLFILWFPLMIIRLTQIILKKSVSKLLAGIQ